MKHGRIIDGKKEYGKRIECGKCPAANVGKDIDTGVNFSTAKLVDFNILLETTGGYNLTIKDVFRLYIDKEWNTIQVFCDTNDYLNCELNIILYYTKN